MYTPIRELKKGQTVIEDDGMGLQYDIISDPYKEKDSNGWSIRVRSIKEGYEDIYFEGEGYEGHCELIVVAQKNNE